MTKVRDLIEPQIISSFICEDIRQEISGKYSLGGVCGSVLYADKLPVTLMLGVILEAKFPKTGSFIGEIQVVSDQRIYYNSGFTYQVMTTAPFVIGVMPISIVVQRAEEIKFQWRFGRGPWRTIRTIVLGLRSAQKTADLSLSPETIN